jgi:hypothetical protein
MSKKISYNSARNKIGAIIRTTDSAARFKIIESAVDNLLKLDEISLINILIYKPTENSELMTKLIEKYGREKKRIEFTPINSGNFYSDLINYAFKEQTRRGIDYSLSVSPEAFEYISRENFDKILDTLKNGSLATGLEIKEYENIIKQGYFSNVFAIYRNTAINFADIWDIQSFFEKENIPETNFGMEELYAIKRLLEIYGPGSVSIVKPEGGRMNYADDENSKNWKKKVLDTKMERLQRMQSILKINPEELKKMIIWN